jgi:hypothetical protein
VYVLDRRLQPVPPGVAGDIYVSGPALARGYTGAIGLTARTFTATPYGPAGDRLYLTGDRGRCLPPDGVLTLAGRHDSQVKIRGSRVELDEVAAVLAASPGVAAAAATVRTAGSGEMQLVGCVVPAPRTFDEQAVRAHLRRLLPDYMVPPIIVTLDALPRTPNGKLDRAALPVDAVPSAAAPPAAPTALESALCAIFRELLGITSVAPDDDFFALGGHSLLAARVANRVRADLALEMPMSALFDAPTVRALAAVLWPGAVAASTEGGEPAAADWQEALDE